MVRSGVHSGTALVREDRLSGAEIHRAARIMQTAGGAQILASEAAVAAARDGLPAEVGFEEFGTVSLRGLRHAERIFTVTHPRLVSAAPDTAKRPAAPSGAPVVLVERERELSQLTAGWEAAKQGFGAVVVVSGEPGIGKTALIRAFLGRLDGARVLRGVCDDLATRRAFGAIRDLAVEASGPLADVAFDDRDAVLAALIDEVRNQPTIVVIEDAHWADDATLDAIHLLARRIDDLPLFLIVSARPTRPEERSVQQEVVGASSLTTLSLQPLSMAAVTKLAGDSPWPAAALHRRTGGNPFFVTELIEVELDTVPTSIREAVFGRLRDLPDGSRQALDQLAVIPGVVDRWLIDVLIDEPLVLDPAENSGLLVAERDGIRFRHELSRQAVAEALPSERRRALHAAVAEALETARADHATIVHHALGSRDRAMVMRHVVPAIRNAMDSGSSTQALDLVDVLEEQHEHDDATLGWAYTQRALALLALDRGEEALPVSRDAISLLEPHGASLDLAEAHHALGRIAWWLRDFDTARPASTEALRVLDRVEPDRASALIRAQVAYLSGLLQLPDAPEIAEHAHDVAHAVGSPRALAITELAIGMSSSSSEEMATHLFAAVEQARAAGDIGTETRATVNLGSSYAHAHRYADAEEWLPKGEELSRRYELMAGLSVTMSLRPWVRAMRGDLEGSLDGLDAYIDLVDNEDQRAWGVLHKGVVLARLGRIDEALDLVEAAEGYRVGRSASPEIVFEAARVEVYWLAGRALDSERIAADVLWPNRFDRPEDYVGRLARNLQRAGATIPRFEFSLAGYDEALWGDPMTAARIWESLGNPYEQGVELGLAGDATGHGVLESIGAAGAVERIFG